MQIVIFKLKDELFAVETAKVQSITDVMEITKVPKAPMHIKGLINLRGNILSLLDINLLLNIDKEDNSQRNVIIIDIEEEEIAILVDEVEEVLEIDEKIIQKFDNELGKEYVKGIVNLKNRIVTLVDLNKLLGN
ncbi:chemotaxis protein CheW [Clostridium massiliamazoniense]|uniref:chemotaxis protein CheW n=1 Tax=Clostridium massiliamazoniense TaxID=1347366 RepID=UPI0006D7DCC7|nr:chemotaxis protein CheW [Clostridium massiliamazoniense]